MNSNSEIITFWAWNGDMSFTEIKSQLVGFKNQGITGVILHARAGLKLHYLEDDWFEAITYTIKEASKLDLVVYLYDEDGWPSGFAGGRVASLSKDYYSTKVEIKKEKPIDGEILLSYHINDNDIYVVGYKDSHYVDLLNPNVVDAFINCTHEKYKEKIGKYFGNTVKGIFTDEPQLRFPYVYNRYIKESYYQKYHENIDDCFYLLEENNIKAKEFRLRYFDIVSNLFHTNYTKKIATWCEKNNLVMMGHFPTEDGLCFYKPNMGVMGHYINMQLPGIDFLGRRLASPVLMKQLESVKNQFNKEKALCEVFAGSGWNTNFNTFNFIWAYNAAFAVNVMCSHLSAYSIEGIRKKDYPAFFSYQEPWFNDYNYLTNSFKNLSDYGSIGKANNDTLVISPLTSIASEKDYDELSKQISTDYRNFVTNLLDKQVRFELTDEDILATYGNLTNNSLNIGSSTYKIVFLPCFNVIRKETLDTIIKARKLGIIVCFISTKPKYVYDGNKLEELDQSILASFDLLNNRDKLLDKYFLYINYQRNIEFRGGFDASLVKDLIINERKVDDDYYYLVVNKSTIDKKVCNIKINKKYAYIAYPTNLDFKEIYLDNGIGKIELLPMESVIIKSSDISLIKSKETNNNYLIKNIHIDKGTRLDDNILVIDNASFKFDDNHYSNVMNVIKLQDEVFKHSGNILYVKYSFNLKNIIKDLKIGIEDIDIIDIKVNNKNVSKTTNYYIDKAITVYDISTNQIIGENEVVITYKLANKTIKNVDDVFETERNRFSYPIVIENIYILGDFNIDVSYDSIEENINHYVLTNPIFLIDKPQVINPNIELSKQGMYFYRGTIRFTFSFVTSGKDVSISLKDFEGVYVKLFINDKYVSLIINEKEIDISKFVKDGINNIALELMCSNRNTLGPFHHKMGELIMTGVNSFKGIRGFEDDFYSFVNDNNTWTNNYSFVRYRIGNIKIKEKSNEKIYDTY